MAVIIIVSSFHLGLNWSLNFPPQYSCPEGHKAMFADDQKGPWDGGLELSCAENDLGWRRYYPDNPMRLGDLVDPATLPVCGEFIDVICINWQMEMAQSLILTAAVVLLLPCVICVCSFLMFISFLSFSFSTGCLQLKKKKKDTILSFIPFVVTYSYTLLSAK